MRLAALLPATVLLAGASTLAHADLFTLTSGSTTISFTLPSSPTPDTFDQQFDYFMLKGVAVTTNGSTATDNVAFFGSSANGGLEIDESNGDALVDQSGPVLFTGSLSAPTFTLGTYSSTKVGPPVGPAGVYDENFSVTIASSTPVSATPEPSSVFLLGSGLLGATGVLRRRLSR